MPTGLGSKQGKLDATFFWTTDWRALWEEWFLALDKQGKQKYRTLYHFIKAHAKIPAQKKFMHWYLGPQRDPDLEKKDYPWCVGGPQDWAKKRAEGGWLSDKAETQTIKEIRRSTNILQKLSDVGDKVHLSTLMRWERLSRMVETDLLRGTLAHPDLTEDQNVKRAGKIVDLLKSIQEGIDKATEVYLRAQGVNLNDVQGLVMLLGSPAVAAAHQSGVIDAKPTPDRALRDAVSDMLLHKTAKFGLPIPDEMADGLGKVVETTSQPVKDKKPGIN
jgi:hypothetical protein